MSVTVKDDLMAPGSWSIDLDHTKVARSQLVDDDNRPRKLHALIYDAKVGGKLICPPLVLLKVTGDEKGLSIGGVGPLWHLGSDGIGPTIVDREYVSGKNKLSNPTFDLGELYWMRAAENSTWVVANGTASVTAGLDADDVFNSDEKFPTRPGYAYRATATGFVGIVRTLYEGKFNPPNLFPTIAGGAWGAQTTNNPQATDNAFTVVGSTLTARTPFPIYQLVNNPLFNQGADNLDYWFASDALRWVADGSGAPDLPTSVHYEGSGFIVTDVEITSGSDVIFSPTFTFTADHVGMLMEGDGIPPYTYLAAHTPSPRMSALATKTVAAPGQSVAFRPNTTNRTHLRTDAGNTNDNLNLQAYPVTKGETWKLFIQVMKTENANGTATISFDKVKTATADHIAGSFFEQAASFSTGGQKTLSTVKESNVRVVTKDTTIEAETTHLGVFIELQGNTDGRWWFSNARLYRFGGNKDWITAASAVTLTPERTYRFSIPCVPGPLLNKEAKARLLVHLSGAGRVTKTVTSSDLTPTRDGTQTTVINLDVTPPSGYDTATAQLMVEDAYNDVFTFGQMTVVDTDRSTMVFDGTGLVDSVAPDGAEFVRVQLVAKQGQSGSVDAVSLARTGVTPATGAAILADVLKDPETGLPLSIVAGTINAPAVIPYDVVIQNMTNRALLDYLCNVVYDGGLEYRINPTSPPTIDVGPPGTVFDTHAPADVLLPEDIDVEDLSNPEVDVEGRATVIRVIGAERQTVSGRPFVITADAQVPGSVEYDFNNRPIVRRRIVSDATVDHHGYAAALAADEAAREAEPALALSAKLSGKATRADMPTGDTIYVYEPEAGLEDDANPVTIEGKTVFPRAIKVLARERKLGPSYRIVMRASDGTTFALPGVLWSDEDATVLTIGDRLPAWMADPQGMKPGVEYLRDRASRPR